MSTFLSNLGLDSLQRPANQLTIEPDTNFTPNILYLDSLHDKNITSLLKALTKNAYNALLLDENIVLAGKKKLREKLPCYWIKM